jgi:predicted nucleotidyltransferase
MFEMITGSVERAAIEPGASGFRAVRDLHDHDVDLAPIRLLLDRIVATWAPKQIWLFGSRARGEAQPSSDWDLFAVVPDHVPAEQLGPLASWRLRKETRTRADVVPCHLSGFQEDRDTPNTMAYEVARAGILLYER